MRAYPGASSRVLPRSLAFALAVGLGSARFAASADDGLAKAFPGDVGIASDARVLFAEDFEKTSVSELRQTWEDVKNLAGMALIPDVPLHSRGTRSLLMTGEAPQNTGGHLYRRLSGSSESLYLRYYVKYLPGGTFHHVGGYAGGYNPATPFPQGGAGTRPRGDDRFSVGFEPRSSTRMDFYTYWMGMGADPGGNYWGNSFIQDSGLSPRIGEWLCIEIMIRMNDPVAQANGELAVWVDGEKRAHLGPGFPRGRFQFGNFTPDPTGTPFSGFQWRSAAQLSTNWIWLQLFTPDGARVQWDHVVAATEYIGPIADARDSDGDGDGISDSLDKCPYYAVQGQADADGDGRGDECECGDQDGNGLIDVSDIVAISNAIFQPELAGPLCDGNNDRSCDVRDLVAVNNEIFSSTSTATCERYPVPGP